MPNRYIKESCTTSQTLTALSDAGERLFWRLTTVADDYGRFDANLLVLSGRCVATLQWPIEKVGKAFSELCQIAPGDEEPLVIVYRVKGRLYGCLTNWAHHQRDRTKDEKPPKPKFPGPQDGLVIPPKCAADFSGVRQLAALNESESESESEDENESVNVLPPTPQLAAPVVAHVVDTTEQDFEEWFKTMPAKGGRRLYKAKAFEFYQRYVKPDERPSALLAAKCYAIFCRDNDRIPCDPHRFVYGQKGEVWREFIPVPAPVKLLPTKTAVPQEPCLPPPAEVVDRLKRIGIKIQGVTTGRQEIIVTDDFDSPEVIHSDSQMAMLGEQARPP